VNESLKKMLSIASEGMFGVSMIDGTKYIMMTDNVLQESLNNAMKTGQFQPNLPPDMIRFIQNHNLLHQLMQNLDYQVKVQTEEQSDEEYAKYLQIKERNRIMYGELDELTFEFSEGMGKPKHERDKVNKEFKALFEKYPILEQMKNGMVKSCPLKNNQTKACTSNKEI
jgi:hypothetical protein